MNLVGPMESLIELKAEPKISRDPNKGSGESRMSLREPMEA